MKRIVKKMKHKEKRKLKNSLKNYASENNEEIISLKSPVTYPEMKKKSKELVDNSSVGTPKLPSHSPRIDKVNMRGYPRNQSDLNFEENEEMHEGNGSWGCSNESEKVHEDGLLTKPFFVEVSGDRDSGLTPLKISGTCFKALPSNLIFGFKSKSTIPFTVKPISSQKCQININSVKNIDLASNESPSELLEKDEYVSDEPTYQNIEDISEFQASNTTQNVWFNPERDHENNTSDVLSVQGESLQRTCSDISGVETYSDSSYLCEKVSDSRMLLAMAHPKTLFVRGSFTMQMVIGSLEVLGYEIEENDTKTYDVYSPAGSSLLSLETKCTRKDVFWKDISSKLSELEVPREVLEKLRKLFPRFNTLVLMQKATNVLLPFLDKYHSRSLFPTPDHHFSLPSDHPVVCLNCEFYPEPELRSYRSFSRKEEWDEVLDFLLDKTKECSLRVMMCGGKSLGKSTFLRFLVNKFLAKFQQVLCIDFDPGQSEFTIPGCVSAILVQKPLLGPHYTHLTQPCRSIYVGNVNVAQCSFHYLKCCEDIYKFCHSKAEFCNIPWIFNTMGFVRGIGVEMIVSLIKMVNLTDIIQIQSVSKKRNYPALLTREYINYFRSTLFRRLSYEESSLQYDLHCFNSAAETQGTRGDTNPWGLEAHKLRDLIVLAYFSQIVSKPAHSLLEAPPFSIPFAGLKLCISHERVNFKHYLAAMNGDLVALCHVGNVNALKPSDPEYPEILESTPVCECVGFGIVRGIDMSKRLVFISSPVRETERNSIDCLVLGSVHLPSRLYTCHEQAVGHVPYVTTGQQPTLSDRTRQTSSLTKKF